MLYKAGKITKGKTMENDIKFIDLFAGVGGFHYGLEQSNKVRKTSKRLFTLSKRNYGDVGKHTLQTTPLNCVGQSYKTENNNNSRKDSTLFGNINKPAFRCVWSNEWDKYAGQIYKKRFPNTPFYEGDIRKINAKDIPDHDLLVAGFPCQSFSVAGKRKGFNETRGNLFFEIVRIAKEKRPRLLLLENVKGLLSHDKGETFRIILTTLDAIGYNAEWEVINSKNFGVPQNRERVFIIGHLRGKSEPKIFPIGQSQESNTKTSNEINKIKNVNPSKKGQSGNVYSINGISPTLNANGGGLGAKTGLSKIGERIRKLTPIECERLQSFPDNWTEGLSDTQRYKCMGNAVTTKVVQVIGEKILNKLNAV